jgi:NADP-dependent 3-hydroxy acid dehydrogenase YdfG
MRTLEGTVAVITGASSGIGEATASELARLGASVALVARRTDRIDALAARLNADSGPGKAVAITADVTDEAQARGAVEQAVTTLGRIDTLVNNAGLMLLGPAVGADLSDWQRMVDLNVKGLMYCTHAALPHLLDAAGGNGVADVVNVSSVAGRVARSGSAAYNATKHAVGAFSEALRQEVARRHLRVSLVEPGATATELRSHNRPEIVERQNQRFAGVTILEASDIAETIAFIVTRPARVAINEVLIRPTEQEN